MNEITFDVMLNEGSVEFLNDGKYVRFPIYSQSIVTRITGRLKEISFSEVYNGHGAFSGNYCRSITISNIVAVEFKDRTCKKFNEVEY